MLKVAVLDDYLHQSQLLADWSPMRGLCEVTVFDNVLGVPDPAAEVLAPFHVLCHLRERTAMPRELIARLPQLACIIVTGKAHRTLDLQAATDHGIVVSNASTSVAPSQATPELTWGLILATARHIALEDRRVRQGRWQSSVGTLLEGKTLGLLGLGRVGQRVARVAHAFGMKVIAWSQNLTPEAASAHGATRVPKDALFAQSDVLSIHLVLSERSHHLVNREALALMKPSAVLINTARGAIVDESALVEALDANRLAGAGLDVFEQEPLPPDHPFLRMDQVVLTPHLGYGTRESLQGFYEATVRALQAYIAGTPLGVVNAEVLGSAVLRQGLKPALPMKQKRMICQTETKKQFRRQP
jgi:D-3-phosphoglycerate dehydrogenase